IMGLYLLPVSGNNPPPQTIISLPVHTAVWPDRAEGASGIFVGFQLSVSGLYLPPVFGFGRNLSPPPQTIISLPVHTAMLHCRAVGALIVVVAVQVSVTGLY